MWCGGVIAVLTSLSLLWKVVLARPARELRATMQWWGKFQRDWDGEPASPGRDAVPGVMQRLNDIDGEFRRNGGESLRDQVMETRKDIELLSSRLALVESRALAIQKAVAKNPG